MFLENLEQALALGIFWCGLLFAILAIVLTCYIATVLSRLSDYLIAAKKGAL
jgi:hypothetical protein